MPESKPSSVKDKQSRNVLPTILLTAFLLVNNVVLGVYSGISYPREPSLRGARIFECTAIWFLIGFWFHRDNQVRRAGAMELSWPWHYIAWPLIMPYYLWRTRGFKCFLPVISFIAILVITTIIGGFAYMLFIY